VCVGIIHRLKSPVLDIKCIFHDNNCNMLWTFDLNDDDNDDNVATALRHCNMARVSQDVFVMLVFSVNHCFSLFSICLVLLPCAVFTN